MKRHLALVCTFALITGPAQAEEGTGLSLMERGAQLFMEGILKEMEPALEGLEDMGPMLKGFVEEMGPALGEILDQVEDWSLYHPPEILPNGDIILRRRSKNDPNKAEDEAAKDPIDI